MKVLFDTNIVMDVILERQPFASAATMLFSYVENDKLLGVLGATTITTLDYLITKEVSKHKAKVIIESLLKLFEIAPVNGSVLENALKLKFLDFEDAVLYEAALQVGTHAIVTRDVSGFNKAEISVYTPKELLETLIILNS